MEEGDDPSFSLPACFPVHLDLAELSAGSPCAVISSTENPRGCLIQVHD